MKDMKTLRTKATLIAVTGLIAAGVLCIAVRVNARPTAVERPIFFGILGITRGQIARINVANVPSPDNPLPPPCRVTMSFVDADGNLLVNNAGQPIQREVTLQSG